MIVGDLATDNDAQRLRESGAPVVQITTGTVCHLEAEMVARAAQATRPGGLNLLIIENVGNLVCPASYDLGEDLRIVLFSVTEGEDKPLKYPPMFQSADVVLISKIDLAQACGYDRDTALANIRRVAPKARAFRNVRQDRPGNGRLARVPAPAAARAQSARPSEPVAGCRTGTRGRILAGTRQKADGRRQKAEGRMQNTEGVSCGYHHFR